MKRILFLTFLTFSSTLLTGQSFFTVGANYSTNSTNYGFPFGKRKPEYFKLTPSIGYGYNFKMNEKWSYQPGIYLGDLGSIDDPASPKVFLYVYAASLNQFIDYKPLPWLSIGISPSISYIAYAAITGKSLHVDQNGTHYNDRAKINWKRVGGDVNRLVFSIVPRVSFHLKERWSVDLFYRNDLTPIGYPPPKLPPPFKYIWKGYGVGVNLKYQLKAKNSRRDE